MEIVHCTVCGKAIERKRYHVKMTEHPFCGFACYASWQKEHRKGVGRKRVTVPCDNCGKLLERHPSAVAKTNFCGRSCFAEWRQRTGAIAASNNPAWLGGHSSYRGPNWKHQSVACMQRDGFTCQRCGATDCGLAVHHVVPFRLFDDYRVANDLDNLITLCRPCHGIEETGFWHAHPELRDQSPFPIVNPAITCQRCGQDFVPRSGQTKLCDDCCTATCAHCGKPFYSRRASGRVIKYCSRTCRNAAIRRPDQVCEGCGKVYTPDRPGTVFCSRECHLTHSNPRRKSSVTT